MFGVAAVQVLVGRFAPAASHAVSGAVSFTLITGLHIVVGELAPKGLALQKTDGTALWVARPIRALWFAERTAGSLMTPHTEVDAIPAGIGLPQLLAEVATTRHTRLPVYRNGLDDLVGVLHVHDLFAVLDRMQARRRQLAVVVDEYGSTAGIVTIEDLVEALVGPIDEEPALGSTPGAGLADHGRATDGSLLLDGLTDLTDFAERTGLVVDPDLYHLVKTLGGLVMAQLGRVPIPGDQVTLQGRVLRVEAMDGYRVATVRLLPAAPPTDPDRR